MIVDLVVCMRVADSPDIFDDDDFGNCSRCGERIRFRPYIPKEPPKVCLGCALAVIEEYKEANA